MQKAYVKDYVRGDFDFDGKTTYNAIPDQEQTLSVLGAVAAHTWAIFTVLAGAKLIMMVYTGEAMSVVMWVALRLFGTLIWWN